MTKIHKHGFLKIHHLSMMNGLKLTEFGNLCQKENLMLFELKNKYQYLNSGGSQEKSAGKKEQDIVSLAELKG